MMNAIQTIAKLCIYTNFLFRDQAAPPPPTAPPLNNHLPATGLDEPPNYNDVTYA